MKTKQTDLLPFNETDSNKAIIDLNPKDFGLTDQTAKNIQDQFLPMLNKMTELEEEYNKILSMPIEDPETSKLAKELRMKYVKVRTGTAEIHKKQKEFYLNGGRYVDGWKNVQLFASQGKEDKLIEIEKYFENKEKERIQNLQDERITLLKEFIEPDSDSLTLNFGEMPDEVWKAFFSAKKKSWQMKIEAEKKAEEERLEKERLEQIEREKQRIENERLKKELEQKEKQAEKLRIESEKKLEIEKKKQQKLEIEKKRIATLNQNRLKKEKEKQEKLAQELKLKNEEIEKNKQLELEKIKKEKEEKERLAKLPIKKQLNNWIQSMILPKIDLDTKEVKEIIFEFNQFKNTALKIIDKI